MERKTKLSELFIAFLDGKTSALQYTPYVRARYDYYFKQIAYNKGYIRGLLIRNDRKNVLVDRR